MALRQMVDQHGVGLLSDAATFRGALDDYFPEGAITAGEVNLLVDSVRLGAVDILTRLTDHGADPASALQSAAEMFARDRGGLDPAAARWACSVVGHAIGKVPEEEVRRPGRPTSSVSPATSPATSPAPLPAPPTLAALPTAAPPPAPPGVPLVPPLAQPRVMAPPPAPVAGRRSNAGRILWTVVVALLAVGVAVGTALLLMSRDNDAARAEDSEATSTATGSAGTSDAVSSPTESRSNEVPVTGGPESAPLTGTWAGPVTELDDDGAAQVDLVLVLGTGAVGDVIGTSTYDLGDDVCHGELTLAGTDADGQDLREDITDGPCVPIGRIHLTANDDRLLFDYTATKKDGGVQRVSGELVRR
ncbi:hypothetical protein [Nocardioides sp. Root614]|uniref:hypothetical protein n=1 Tax=Nocardioides sp. Root614 TaxID=1736571 RepID=UPI0012E3A8EA|nr:hypothetical protein [Nocardioides sp. Root614]